MNLPYHFLRYREEASRRVISDHPIVGDEGTYTGPPSFRVSPAPAVIDAPFIVLREVRVSLPDVASRAASLAEVVE